jgi:hypothetical protein
MMEQQEQEITALLEEMVEERERERESPYIISNLVCSKVTYACMHAHTKNELYLELECVFNCLFNLEG